MTTTEKAKHAGQTPPTSEEFTRTLGQATWLMTVSKQHRSKDIAFVEAAICAPLMYKQLRVFLQGKQPVAVLTWAYASEEVKAKVEAGEGPLQLHDWRSGPEVVVVDCISPFTDKKKFIDAFMSEVASIKAD